MIYHSYNRNYTWPCFISILCTVAENVALFIFTYCFFICRYQLKIIRVQIVDCCNQNYAVINVRIPVTVGVHLKRKMIHGKRTPISRSYANVSMHKLKCNSVGFKVKL